MAKYRIIQYQENYWAVEEKESALWSFGKLLMVLGTLGMLWLFASVEHGLLGFWSPWRYVASGISYEEAYKKLLTAKAARYNSKKVVRYFD